MSKIPAYIKSENKGAYIGVEVVSIGMAINILATAEAGQGLAWSGVAAGFFLAAGVAAVLLVQRIESVTTGATSLMVTQSVISAMKKESRNRRESGTREGEEPWSLEEVWSFEEAYGHQLDYSRHMVGSGFLAAVTVFGVLLGGLMWLMGLDLWC